MGFDENSALEGEAFDLDNIHPESAAIDLNLKPSLSVNAPVNTDHSAAQPGLNGVALNLDSSSEDGEMSDEMLAANKPMSGSGLNLKPSGSAIGGGDAQNSMSGSGLNLKTPGASGAGQSMSGAGLNLKPKGSDLSQSDSSGEEKVSGGDGSLKGALSIAASLRSRAPKLTDSDEGAINTEESAEKADITSGKKPMAGAGLNIVKPAGGGKKRMIPIRGLRTVASDAEPLNRLRELSFDHHREINLVERMFQSKLIGQSQCDQVVERLHAAAKDKTTLIPISALFELKEVELVNIDNIINFLVRESKIPFVSLKSFRISNDVFTKLPPDIAERLGVVLFGVVGRAHQVAVLNPLDKDIQKAICDYLGTTDVSFFLVKPDDITPIYDKLRSQLADL